MPELSYVNGLFGPISEAKVSIEDRGYQFGDGVYEVVAVYGGRPFLLDRHIARFQESCAGIGLMYDFQNKPLEPIIREGLSQSGLNDALVYIQLTRGVAPRSHTIPPGLTPTVVMTFKPLPTIPDEFRRRGAKIMTTPDTRWAKCHIKAITLLPNVLARNEALQKGYDDALFVSENGEVRECTAANVFAVRSETIWMPPRTESVLHGVTQGFLLECVRSVGLSVNESPLHLETIRSADEVFMSSTSVEVLGITSIDNRPVGTGSVGLVTKRLFETFRHRSRA